MRKGKLATEQTQRSVRNGQVQQLLPSLATQVAARLWNPTTPDPPDSCVTSEDSLRLIPCLCQRLAARLHCGEVWVLTERDNVPAMSLYASVPKARQDDAVMFTLPPLQK